MAVATDTGLSNVVAVAPGETHTVAIDANGDVWTWGSRSQGALGDGSTSGSVLKPQKLTSLSNAVAAAAGESFSLVLKSDGTVWGFGRNGEGQLGDGTTTQRTTPVQVPSLSGVSAIAAGAWHSLALQTDGGPSGIVWAFGRDHVGQLGDGANVNRSSPIRVAENVRQVAAFNVQSLLLTDDSGFHRAILGAGTHYGNNIDGSTPSATTRFITLSRDDYVEVSAGTSIMLGLRADTTIFEWGTMESTGAEGESLGDDTGVGDDPDGDGLSNAEEWALGTDPYDADTNDDGILDGIARASGMSATDPDMDGDGVLNGAERAQGTDPFHPDTDGDSVNDGADDFPLDPTRTTAPSPDPEDTTPPDITLEEPTNATLVSTDPP